jgi:2'-5' RNA ligase
MRLFVALDIPDTIRHALADYAMRLNHAVPSVRFVRTEGLHITLKFLGETEKTDQLREALSRVQQTQFPVALANTGFFPNAERPRIFWAGIDAPTDLAELARKVDEACSMLGFPREDRPFTPHLTLARSGSGNPRAHSGTKELPLAHLAHVVRSEDAPRFGMMVATQFHLYASQLHPQGSIYSKIATFDLKPAP